MAKQLSRGARLTTTSLASGMGISVEIGDIPADALREADEAFLTSTAGGIMPIEWVDGRHLGSKEPGSLSGRLRDEYWRRREAGWLAIPVNTVLA